MLQTQHAQYTSTLLQRQHMLHASHVPAAAMNMGPALTQCIIPAWDVIAESPTPGVRAVPSSWGLAAGTGPEGNAHSAPWVPASHAAMQQALNTLARQGMHSSASSVHRDLAPVIEARNSHHRHAPYARSISPPAGLSNLRSEPVSLPCPQPATSHEGLSADGTQQQQPAALESGLLQHSADDELLPLDMLTDTCEQEQVEALAYEGLPEDIVLELQALARRKRGWGDVAQVALAAAAEVALTAASSVLVTACQPVQSAKELVTGAWAMLPGLPMRRRRHHAAAARHATGAGPSEPSVRRPPVDVQAIMASRGLQAAAHLQEFIHDEAVLGYYLAK